MPRIFRVRQPRHVHCYISIQGSLLSIFSHLVAVQPGCQGRLPFRARVPHAPTRCCRHFTTAAAIRQRTLLVFIASLSLDLLADAEGPPLAAPLASKRKRDPNKQTKTSQQRCTIYGVTGLLARTGWSLLWSNAGGWLPAIGSSQCSATDEIVSQPLLSSSYIYYTDTLRCKAKLARGWRSSLRRSCWKHSE